MLVRPRDLSQILIKDKYKKYIIIKLYGTSMKLFYFLRLYFKNNLIILNFDI